MPSNKVDNMNTAITLVTAGATSSAPLKPNAPRSSRIPATIAWKLAEIPKTFLQYDITDETTGAVTQGTHDAGKVRAGIYIYLHWAISIIGRLQPDDLAEGVLDVDEQSKWQSWVATQAINLLDEHFTSSSRTFMITSITQKHIAVLKTFAQALNECIEDDLGVFVSVAEKVLDAVNKVAKAFGFPLAKELVEFDVSELVKSKTTVEMASYFAIVTFLAGRSDSDKVVANVRERRTKNLYDSHNGKVEFYTVGGELTIAPGTIKTLIRVWSADPTFRSLMITTIIPVSEGSGGIIGAIVGTTLKMNRYAGMNHVLIVSEFLRRFPFVCEMPAFEGQVFLYCTYSSLLAREPLALQPYFKMIKGDQTGIFDKKQLDKLIGLAVEVLATEDENENLRQYAHNASSVFMDEFERAREAYEESDSNSDSDRDK